MTRARVLTGSKQEIANEVARLEGEVREAIVFIDEAAAETQPGEDIFAEMEAFAVRQDCADDSRDAIYRRVEGE